MLLKIFRLPKFLILALVFFAILLSSCNHSGEAAKTNNCTPSSDHRVVSVSPTATEMLFAIGAGSQAVAVDEFSTYPSEAPSIQGLSGFTPNAEAILEYEPSLLLTQSSGSGDEFTKLEGFDVCVLRLPAVLDLQGVYGQLNQLGEIVQRKTEAQNLVTDLKSRVEQVVTNSGRQNNEVLTYFYELDTTFYTVTDNTFIGYVLGLLSLRSVAPTDTDLGDFPQLNPEAILSANPDIIMLVDVECCQQNAATVASRAGWENIKAVQNNKILELNGDVASRWGPRIVDLLENVSDFLSQEFS